MVVEWQGRVWRIAAAMADWESGDYGRSDPRARRAAKSSAQSSKAELLAAIAARRQAQLMRSTKAPSPSSGLLFRTLGVWIDWLLAI